MTTKHKRRSRPTREERSSKALAGVDVSTCDERRELRTIALDKTLPAAARVAALRTLCQLDGKLGREDRGDDERTPSQKRADEINSRAVALLRRKPR